MVGAGEVHAVVAQDADRITREPVHRALLDEEFERRGCRLYALDDWGDGTHEGELLKYLKGWVSKGERLKMAERTRRGRLQRVREGKLVATTPPYGFLYNPASGRFEVDDKTMPTVRLIFQLAGDDGLSLRAIKRELEGRGTPTARGRSTWGPTTIRQILLRDAYKPHPYEEIDALVLPAVRATLDPGESYGISWYNRKHAASPDEWVAVPVPDAGISADTVRRAREALSKNVKRSRADGRFWPLSGRARCACGGALCARSTRNGKGQKFYYYVCGKHLNGYPCEHVRWHNADKLEIRIFWAVWGLVGNPESLRARIAALHRRGEGDPSGPRRSRQGGRGDPERARLPPEPLPGDVRRWCHDRRGAEGEAGPDRGEPRSGQSRA